MIGSFNPIDLDEWEEDAYAYVIIELTLMGYIYIQLTHL